MLISIKKGIELNSESKPTFILFWVWVHTRDPDPVYTFFGGGEKSACTWIKTYKQKLKPHQKTHYVINFKISKKLKIT